MEVPEKEYAGSNQCIYKRSVRKDKIEIIEPRQTQHCTMQGDVVSVNALRDASIRMIQILQLIKLLPQI